MLGKIKQITTAQWLFLTGFLVVIFIAYNLILVMTRGGEIKVNINVLPDNAKVTINNKPHDKTVVYLSEGKYDFSASADGWKTDTQIINISKDNHQVYLLPDPESEDAKNWLEKNPKIQLKREELGGEKAAAQNQAFLSKNPLLQYLPYSQESPPFTIDYGPSPVRKNDIFLTVSGSSPNGRQAALDWIRQQGADPTDLDITFSGFVNPLSGAGINSD